MMVTLAMVDGKKITWDDRKLKFFTGEHSRVVNRLPEVLEGYLTVNLDNVLFMRMAKKEEIEYAETHRK